MTLHFLNDFVNGTKIDNCVIIASSLKSEPPCKLLNRIPGFRLLISSSPSSVSLTIQQAFSKSYLVNLISKKHLPSILYMFIPLEKVMKYMDG